MIARALGMILFLVVFLGIYLGMHLYVFLRLFGMLGLERGILLYGVTAILSVSFPLLSFVMNTKPSAAISWLYTASATWLGVLFLLFSALIVYELLSMLFSLDRFVSAIVIISVALVLSAAAVINAMFLAVKVVEVPLDGLPSDLKIVQLSDLHLGTVHNSAYLKKVVDKANALDPDMVVITGDLVDGMSQPHTYKGLDRIKADTYFITGNHERYQGKEKVFELLSSTKVKILDDEALSTKGIQLIGLSDGGDFKSPGPKLQKIQIEEDKPSVLLYHAPTGIEDAAKEGIDLQVSGHTHNGQLMPFNFLVWPFYPRIKGLYQVDGTYLYVSPGTGTWGPPMRLGSRSEITLLGLKHA